MVRHHQPRKGSVAFSPRKRVAKETPRIKAWLVMSYHFFPPFCSYFPIINQSNLLKYFNFY